MKEHLLFLLSLAIFLAFLVVFFWVLWYIALPIFLVLLVIFFISSAWHSYQMKKTLKAWQALFSGAIKPHKKKTQEKVIDVEFKEL